MSIKSVSTELKRFLESKDPEVICIMGKWGIGKTYTWKKYLQETSQAKKIGLKRYSYVSLFGLNTIESVKNTLFEATVETDCIKNGPNIKTFQDNFKSMEVTGRALTRLARNLPKIKDYVPDMFITVRNQIICIDDLERTGGNLSTIEIFGLISFLKNERNCKIVLLFNDEQLKDAESAEFKKQLEKVIDIKIRFEPLPEEAADIAVDKTTSFCEELSKVTTALGITNIRVIKKIENLLKKLEKLLIDNDRRIFNISISSVALLSWSIYEPTFAPSLDFIKNFVKYADIFLDKDKQESENEKKWRLMINSIQFSNFDEWDALLLTIVQNGYIDEEILQDKAKELDKQWELQDNDNSFHEAWQKYRHSFDLNDDTVLNGLYEAFKKNVQSVSPTNLDATLVLFRKFNRNDQANEMVDLYMNTRDEKPEFYDSNRSMFLNIKDPVLITAFTKKLSSFKDSRSTQEILEKIAKNSGWNPEDIEALTAVSENEFYDLFKKTKGNQLIIIVSQALKFASYNPSDEKMERISLNAENALKRIAKESKMNSERVKSLYGITIDD